MKESYLKLKDIIDSGDNLFVVHLHSVADRKNDELIKELLTEFGELLYLTNINLTFNGYTYIKLTSYMCDPVNEWLGNFENQYDGAQYHARNSIGINSLRIFVLRTNNFNKILETKEKIRAIFNLGKFSVHINDHNKEAISLLQIYLNPNSIFFINNFDFNLNLSDINKQIDKFKTIVENNRLDLEKFCIVGSSPMTLFGLRKNNDLDFITDTKNLKIDFGDNISNHSSELKYYPVTVKNILYNPKFHFYYRGVKFITLNTLLKMKKKRNEDPKDINDVTLIENYLSNKVT